MDEEEEEALSIADVRDDLSNPLDGMVNIKMAEFKKAMIYNLLERRL